MSELREVLNTAAGDVGNLKAVDLEALSAMVEAQIDNVVGGDYSQCGGYHGKAASL